MTELKFAITYDGRDAAEHRIDMRRYGRALVGLDRIINAGLVGLTEQRVPNPRERYRLAITVTEPQRGCVAAAGVVMAAYDGAQAVLPFLIDQVKTFGIDIIWTWLDAAFKILGGRSEDAEPQIKKIIHFMDNIDRRHLEDRQLERDAIYKDKQAQREFVLKLIEALRPAAREVVGPVGTSAAAVYFGREFDERTTEVDEPMATAIRSKVPLQVGNLETYSVLIDGFRRSNAFIWVKRVGIDIDWIKAVVRDPAFEGSPNLYTEAAESGEPLTVTAKLTLKGSEVHQLFIMDAVAPPETEDSIALIQQ